MLAGLRAGLAPGGELVLESTPNGAEGCFYEQWRRAEEIGLVRHFFPWWMEERYRAAAVDGGFADRGGAGADDETWARAGGGPGGRLGRALDLEQIGFRRSIRAGLQGLARQEFVEDAETCFLMSGESYFELEAIERRMKTALDPVGRRQNGRLQVWLEPQPGRWYVVAVDPAGGGAGGGDRSAIQVIDLETGLQCAEFAGHVGGMELMELAREIAWDYETAWLVVERNNHGGEQLSPAGAEGVQPGVLRVGWAAGDFDDDVEPAGDAGADGAGAGGDAGDLS